MSLSIEVTVDDSVVDANKSVSLGLIVTELVINALKHAFPDSGRVRLCRLPLRWPGLEPVGEG